MVAVIRSTLRSIQQRLTAADLVIRTLTVLMIAVLLLVLLVPLLFLFVKAFQNNDGAFIGLDNFLTYFTTASMLRTLTNTLFVSGMTTVISVALAFLYAYGIVRTSMSGKRLFKSIALLPLFAPTMMHALSLTYLFGNQGIVTNGFFGLLPFGIHIEIYGPIGIIISEVIYTFPQAYMIFLTALSITDYRLYEASESLGASKWRTFCSVTVPTVKYGLISAAFVCFTASFIDFGAPQSIGGQFSVLATDIYKQVIGQQNMPMGATVGILLTIPAVIAFAVDRFVERKQKMTLTAKSTAYQIKENKGRDLIFLAFSTIVAACILIPLLTIVFASLVKTWPYNLSLSLSHYNFSKVAAGGMGPFMVSLKVAALTAVVGTIATFVFAYLIEKSRDFARLRQFGYFLSVLPMALPGMALGLAYIFFFNEPSNPLGFMYATIAILVLVNVVHFYSVPFITATASLKKLDKEIEAVSESMSVPFYRTFIRVTVPMSLPAILEIAMYFFVNAMVTISAVVFLYAPDLKPAAVSIVNMDDAGDVAAAAAMSVLVVAVNLAVRSLYELLVKGVRKKTQAWYASRS
jgi:iron(III) transport system permease protein